MSLSFKYAIRTVTKARSFHSPFRVLGTSPIATPPTAANIISAQYEKQYDHPPEPRISHSGYKTYVVSEPDATSRHYEVPAGAYPTSAPYIQFAATAAPDTRGAEYSSTGGELLAHEFTTNAVPRHAGGVGESSAIRHGQAPGEMGKRGGGKGGLGLMDEAGTVLGKQRLADRNPAPDEPDVAERFSKAGVEGAWKMRK